MKIWIVNHYAVMPDKPGGTRHYELARRLAVTGHDVTVIAAGFHYVTLQEQSHYNAAPFNSVDIEGFRWVWIKTHPYASNNHHRIFNMWSFSQNLRKFARAYPSPPDIVIGSTVHPFAAFTASGIAKRAKAVFWFEIRDLWPQTMIDNGTWKAKSLASRFFRWIEKRTLSRACGVMALSPLTSDYLLQRYRFPKELVVQIPNGSACGDLDAVPENQIANSKVVMLYAGGMDQVHSLDHLIKALALPGIPENLEVHLTGTGKMREQLIRLANELNVKNVIWNNPVPKNQVRDLLMKADFLFLCTSRVLYGSENKLAEYLEAGKPIITYTAASHNDPVEKIGCGFSSVYGDVDELAVGITKMAQLSSVERDYMGAKGRIFFKANLNWDTLAQKALDFMGLNPNQPALRLACGDDALAMAELHKELINIGFLSSLPVKFLASMYQYLISKHIVYVCCQNGSVMGFVSGVSGNSSVMTGFLKTHLFKATVMLFPHFFTPGFFKKVLETLRYSNKMSLDNIPDAELLSIAVHPGVRSSGIGNGLLKKLEQRFASDGIKAFKVIAGEELISANRFYHHNGFDLAGTIQVHCGTTSNIYVKSLNSGHAFKNPAL